MAQVIASVMLEFGLQITQTLKQAGLVVARNVARQPVLDAGHLSFDLLKCRHATFGKHKEWRRTMLFRDLLMQVADGRVIGEHDIAPVGRAFSRNEAGDRTFAGTIRPHNAYMFPRVDAKASINENVLGAEAFTDILEINHERSMVAGVCSPRNRELKSN